MAETRASSQWLFLVLLLVVVGAAVYTVNTLAKPLAGAEAADASGLRIHEAAAAGDLAAVKAELAGGVPVDSKIEAEAGQQGMTPLMAAAMAGKPEVLRALLDAGARTEARAADGRTALFFAAGWGGAESVAVLLGAGAAVDARIDGQWTPLMIAAARGELEAVRALKEAGADIEAGNKFRQTPLMFAAMSGSVEKVRELLSFGASVAAMDKDNNTALGRAADAEVGAEVLAALIDAGADVNHGDYEGVTPLMKAALRGDAEQVKVLLAAGADAGAKDARGWTALEHARARSGDDKGLAVEALLGGGN